MFIQWGWVRTTNLESDVRAQLKALRVCNETLYTHPERLSTLRGEEMLGYFGRCWRGTWQNFVANSMPYVCLRSWIATGFRRHQFMLVPQARLRRSKADVLLPALANFTGLHYNKEVLMDKEEELRVHCEAPPSAHQPHGGGRRASSSMASSSSGRRASLEPSQDRVASTVPPTAQQSRGPSLLQPRSQERRLADAARGDLPGGTVARHGWRRRMRAKASGGDQGGAPAEDPVKSRPLVNSHADYTGRDAVRRTQLTAETHAELGRLAAAHTKLLMELGVRVI